jgi:2-polyprenylphenol 6-hydroxylase
MKQVSDTDIIIVGAGLVGLAAAITFAEQGRRVMLLDAKKAAIKETDAWDARIYALTPVTERWFDELGVWPLLNAQRVNPIHAMHLWHGGAENPLVLADSDANLARLGVIAESKNLEHALRSRLDELSGATVIEATCKTIENTDDAIRLTLEGGQQLSAKLLVAADGANSFVRKYLGIATNSKLFHQTAIVANFATENSHHDVAHQWFSTHETFALLPLVGKNVSLVWSLSTEEALQLLSLSEREFTECVQEKSQQKLGELKLLASPMSFELKQITATQLIANRVALVGDAAHQVHPMAGQGVNLGFKDVVALQKLLADAHSMQDIGEFAFLRRYERARKADILAMNSLTSGLDFLFASERTAINKLTNWGLQQVKKYQSLKSVLIKQAVN